MPQQPHNQGKRVTDRDGVSFDAASQAVRMQRLEGDHNLLAAQVKASVDNCTGALNSVQLEVRTLTSNLGKFSNMQHAHETNTTAIHEVKNSVNDLGRRLEGWMSDFERRNTEQWNQYRLDRDSWRSTHERLNEETKDVLHERINTVREATIRILAWAGGAGALAAVIAAGFLWSLNDRFNNTAVAVQAVDARVTKNTERVTSLDTRNTDKIHQIELYLARGGENAKQPYVPPEVKPEKEP